MLVFCLGSDGDENVAVDALIIDLEGDAVTAGHGLIPVQVGAVGLVVLLLVEAAADR